MADVPSALPPAAQADWSAFWAAYAEQPYVLALAALVIIVYSAWLFNQPTRKVEQDAEIHPPKRPRLLTTKARYACVISLYIASWFMFFAAVALFPGILMIVVDHLGFGADLWGSIQSFEQFMKERNIPPHVGYPVIILFFAIGFSLIPPFSTIEETIRNVFNKLAAIPLKAFLVRNVLLETPLKPRCLSRSRAEQESCFPLTKTMFHSLYQSYLKSECLCDSMRRWSQDRDLSKFAALYRVDIDQVIAAHADVVRKAVALEMALIAEARVADQNNGSSRTVPQEGHVIFLSNELSDASEQFMKRACILIGYAVLSCFSTERSRNDAIRAIGFRLPREATPADDETVDVNALSFTAAAVFVITLMSVVVVGILPNAWFGIPTSRFDTGLVTTGMYFAAVAVFMHFIAIILAINTRRWLGNTRIGHAIDSQSAEFYPFAMYLLLGGVGFVWGGSVCFLLGSSARGTLQWGSFAWGAVTFVTGASVGFHVDWVHRVLHGRVARDPVVFGHRLSMRTIRSLVQATATVAACLLAAHLVAESRGEPVGNGKWYLFLVVSTGCIGGFIGYHLPINIRRRTQAGRDDDEAPGTSLAAQALHA